MNSIELLSPAGSSDALVAAVQSGADAVYTGGRLFSARQSADNFSFEDLQKYAGYCHLYGVKLHVALNTLIKQREIPQLIEYIKELGSSGVDALIVQDMGAVSLIKKILPDMELHASTQMTVTTLDGVRFLEENGFRRVVLARELSKENIEYICKNTRAEIEVFGHGALCICYSGQCLMSSIIGGRSGNRGRCAQPCRLPYKLLEKDKRVLSGYLMSPKDLCLADRLGDLKDMGVASLKIEGRLKRSEYVAAVTGVYRKYLDKPSKVIKSDMTELMNAFNRSGFTQGYFSGCTGKSMMSTEKPGNDSTNIFTDEVKRRSRSDANVRKISINMFCALQVGEAPVLTVWDNDGNTVSEKGTQKCEAALNKPTDSERIRQQLLKTGATPFTAEDCIVETDGKCAVAISTINEMRRTALEKLKQIRSQLPQYKVHEVMPPKITEKEKGDIKLTAEIHTLEQYDAVCKAGVDEVYVPYELFNRIEQKGDTKIIFKMPDILRDDLKFNVPDCDSVMITHFGQKKMNEGKKLYGDFRLNVFNSYTADFYSDLERITLSPELNIHEMKDLTRCSSADFEVIAYGRLPLMITQNCPARQHKCSNHGQTYSLEDRRAEKFPLICQYGCTAKIVNSKPVFMADKISDIKNLQINSIRLIFTVENFSECDKIVNVYRSALNDNVVENCFGEGQYTRGHFYRGVQ